MTTTREDTLLQQALQAARAKHELTARDLFLDVVKINRHNEIAWMWLTGLLDNLDDCIHACEQVLEINPDNEHARQYLAQLMGKRQIQLDEKMGIAQGQLQKAISLAKARKTEQALNLMRTVVLDYESSPEAWRLIVELSPDMDEQIHALDKLVTLTPEDERSKETLNHLRHLKKNPHELATIHEEQGDVEKAIDYYYQALAQEHLKDKWYDIDQKIMQLKMRLNENIEHVSPAISITRLAAGPSLLYFLLVLIEVGINPFANPEPILWIGFLLTMLGSFMIALATVRSHHRLWLKLFKDLSAGGSPLARIAMGMAGWFLLLISFSLLFFMDYLRLLHNPF